MMEGRDHGEMLTRFEEMFGSLVEHEVIKLILQSCDWDASMASDTLLGMIDRNNLPPHVRSALSAESLVRSLTRGQPASQTQECSYNQSASHSTIQTSAITVPQTSAFSPSKQVEQRPKCNNSNDWESVPPPSSLLHKTDTPEVSNPSPSTWVMAPQFVPNASRKGSNEDNVAWAQRISSTPVPASSAISPDPQTQGKWSRKEEIIGKILNGTKLVVLMRGLPGSGKTTLAKELKGPGGVILSTDDFFCDKHGEYIYNPSRIGEAHQWNKHRAIQRLKEGRTPIIIDNTNMQKWEMKPYIQLGLQYGYDLDILEVETPWNLNCKELARRNTHGVSAKKIEEMKGRYERNVRMEDLIASLQGLDVTQQSPSRNHTPGADKDDLQGMNLTPKCSPFNAKIPVVDLDVEVKNNVEESAECDDNLKEELTFDSDEDVIVEGYYDQIIPTIHGASNEELQLSEFVKSLSLSASEIKEKPSCDQENVSASAVSNSELPDRINATNENFDGPIDLTLAVQTSELKKDERKDNGTVERTNNLHIESNTNSTDELENVMDDETKIQTLLDEACKSIDMAKSEKEWDNLTSQIAGENFSEEKFNDLVTSFGCALKKQIENRDSIVNIETNDCNVTSDVMSEDFAMYDLCSTMEDKTGQPLSSLITKLARSDESTNIPSIKIVGPSKDDESYIILPSNDSHTNDLPTNSVLMNVEEGASNLGSSAKKNKQTVDMHKDVAMKSSPNKSKENKDKKNQDLECTNTVSECGIPEELGNTQPSRDTTYTQPDNDGLLSWECVDINSGSSSINWDSKADSTENNVKTPKSCRTQRNRPSGDPSRWLGESYTQSESIIDAVSSWVAVEGDNPDWDTQESTQTCTPAQSSPSKTGMTSKYSKDKEELESHTGAISKLRKHRRHNSPSPSTINNTQNDTTPSNDSKTVAIYETTKSVFNNAETQTLSIDFEALQLDHNLYELKVLYGRAHYVPVTTASCNFNKKGPLTKGELRLDKGTMTDNVYDNLTVSSFQNLVAFFPNIPKEDLRDVFEKCKYDSDWAMNVLLDSGYEMSDPSDITTNDVTDVNVETDSVSETNTDDGKSANSSDPHDAPCDSVSDDKTRRIKQSQQPQDLAKKMEIEQSFDFPESVDDQVLRLTGKKYDDLNMTKIKRSKARNQVAKRNDSPSNSKGKESVDEEIEGAQFITLVMDPLFASQLNMLFGPVGDCEISGDLTHEDRSVVLPLEICEMIHSYWARTVNGKFLHEAEILDTLLRQDEILARKLQEEEEENAAFNSDNGDDNEADDGLLQDQPVCFQEIMNLEQALQESLANQTTEDTSISSQLNLQRLYKEYPHVDPVALKEEYVRNNHKYHPTVERLNQRYGKELGTPKTVIAPEALSRYEQEMIERAQQTSLEEHESKMSSDQNTDVVPDNPQVYRDEAHSHYHQRQEAFQKAQEAYRRGMKTAAAYYAHIGNLHSEKLREANQRASHKILEAKNAHRKDANCLDLHLLHVPEAISATQAFLYERQRVLIARGIRQMEVSLITGRGAHSVGGQAVLKPSIKDYLHKHGYSFYEGNSGMLKVILHSKPS